MIAVPHGHRLAGQNTITARDLADYHWVVPQRKVPRRAAIHFAKSKSTPTDISGSIAARLTAGSRAA